MQRSWKTVASGMPGRILTLQAALEAEGFPTFVPDGNVKTMDPFITGANALDLELCVPADVAERAAEYLSLVEEARRAPPEPPASEQELELARASLLARRMGWAALFGFTAPYTLWLAPQYFASVRRAGARPSGHWVALCAIPLAVAGVFALGAGARGMLGL